MIDPLSLYVLGTTLLSLGFTVFYVRRVQKGTKNTLDELNNQLIEGLETISKELQPIIETNSRVMGVVSSMGDETKMDKALERRIGLDLMGENEDILEMVKMAFPNVAEYLEDHPEAISKLLPRLNTLISDPEARKRLKLDFSSKGGDVSRIWLEERD